MSSGGAVNYLANWPAQGTGAAAAPYIIGSTAEWNTFATKVCNGISFSGRHLRLNGNIRVSVFVGPGEDSPFCGLADIADNSTTISENDVGNSKRWGSAF